MERLLNASLSVDTLKFYKRAVLNCGAFREQYNVYSPWLPNIDNIVSFMASLFPEGYIF